MPPNLEDHTSEQDDESESDVGPHSGSYHAFPRDPQPPQEREKEKPGCIANLFGWTVMLGIVAAIIYGINSCVSSAPDPPVRSPEDRTTSTNAVPPPPELPPHVIYQINERYDSISAQLLERVLAEVVDWYRQEFDLVAETPSVIAIEPQCNPTAYSEALGFARRITDDAGHSLVEVCVRLDEDNDAAIESEEFKWLLAHEYFHVLQANAGWAFEEPGSIFGSQGECGRHLTEGSAEYFGQLYAWGELQGGGILDTLATLFAGDVERWYYYDDGARAFNALVEWQAHDRATRFWESDEVRCADAFLSAFDVAPGKFETDWQELTAR